MNGGLGPGCVKGIRRGVMRAYGGIQGLRAALTGKHNTLVRMAPGWQGAPDGQQAKKIVATKCLFYMINVSI